jgi:acyl-CoA synthetase (AMP-forming)/AMP-acid ligase II/acyl carrier protein
VVLDNAYGPTEATVISTVHAVAAADGHPPIGRPLPNTRAYVVDPTLGLLPPGVPGELVVAGEHVAQGYLNESGQTVRAFITDPVLGEAKAYRTGDRVRWRPDGRLEYQSRLDSQVKVRGFRIEPAEIEAVLDEHPMVRSAAVAPDAAGRLIAYVVIASEPSASSTGVADSTFREFLAERLPAHLVPARYVRLDALPLAPSGKLDRSRLPAPAPTRAAPRGRPPARGVEQKIVLLWSEALTLDPGGVGMDDDFGDSGGHSLLAAQLMSLVGEEFGVEVSLESFFRHPTPGHLAQLISRPVEQR